MGLDVHTTIVILLVTLLLGQGFLIYLYRLGYPVPGIRYFFAGGMALEAGIFLCGARGRIPDFASIVVANTCLVLAYVLYWAGIRCFLGRRLRLWVGALCVLFALGGMDFLLATGVSFAARAFFIRLSVAILMGAVSYELLAGRERKYGRPQRLIGWLHLVDALFLATFAVQSVISGETGKLLSGKGTTGLLFLTQILYSIIWTVGLIMMLGERFLIELRAAKEAAESASRGKSEFLANMSHEMRTPLAGLSGLLRLLSSEGLDPVREKYVTSALSAAESLSGLIDDLLDLSRIEAGGELIETSVFDPRELFSEALYPLEILARRKGLDFTLDASVAPGPLLGDPKRLRQVAVNLVGNAVKFTPAGRVAVTVGGSDAAADRSILRLAVEDSGIGIPAGEIENIFKKFTQIHVDPAFGGAGLGLAICRRIARAMGGDITVRSRPGQGSRFTFEVSLQRPSDATIAALAEQAEMVSDQEALARLAPRRILLVEDFEPIRLSLSRMLTRAGHRTLCAANGREALEAVLDGDFDVILMDVRMPVMDGVEATKRIRALADPPKARIPIVAMTAHAFSEDRAGFLAAGMDEHLAKPVNPGNLARVLSRFATAGPPSVGAKDEGLINWEVALTYAGGDRDELRLYCANIAKLLGGEIEIMATALREEDWPLFSSKAHSLKSLAAGLGADGLAETLKRAELSGDAGDSEILAHLFPLLEEKLHVLLREVGAFATEETSACTALSR